MANFTGNSFPFWLITIRGSNLYGIDVQEAVEIVCPLLMPVCVILFKIFYIREIFFISQQ